jgi:AAA domain
MPNASDAPSSLIIGPAGAGKTSAIATYGAAGIETFVLFTEPKGHESLLDSIARIKAPLEKFHWTTITAPPAGWTALKQMATTIRVMGYEDIAKLKQGIQKTDMKQLEALLDVLANFPDERTGQTFGDVTTWDDRRAFVLDSLSGLNLLAWLTTVGYKPTAHEGEWGMAMNLEEQIIHKLTSDCKCYFTLIGHIDREPDPITGASRVMTSALGRKLAPKLQRMFGDVVRARRTTNGFFWSTVDNEADLKNRSLPVSGEILPDFKQIVDAHARRKSQLQPSG